MGRDSLMTAGRTNADVKSQHWNTPTKYVEAVKKVLGGRIELDPCSNEFSVVGAETEYRLPQDGLGESWDFRTIYVNPPYGSDQQRGTRISHWLARCADAHDDHGSEVIARVPVAPNTKHWKRSVFGRATSVCFLYDTRLRFLEDGQDTGKGAPMACAMIYWGRHPDDFFETFIEHGAVVDIRRLNGVLIGTKQQTLL